MRARLANRWLDSQTKTIGSCVNSRSATSGDGDAEMETRARSIWPSAIAARCPAEPVRLCRRRTVTSGLRRRNCASAAGRFNAPHDITGVVISGPREWQGVPVWGTGGDVGFSRDGSHAQLMSVPVDALVRKPERLSFEEASAVGVNVVTAWYGAVEAAELSGGESIAVFGVSGAPRSTRNDRDLAIGSSHYQRLSGVVWCITSALR
jgi:hypothetical protein